MSDDDAQFSGTRTDRRTVLQTAGVGAAALLGLPSAAADPEGETPPPFRAFPLELLNPRQRNAAHAWTRGYIGRADRTVALTDSGADARHGDLGPWNGVRTTNDGGAGELRIADAPDGIDSLDDVELPDADELPQFVAWHDTNLERPRDTNGHGTGVTSIMAGSGRSLSLDPESFLETFAFGGEEPRELAAGETVEVTFDVPADVEELFAGVGGNWLDVTLVGPDGGTLDTAFVAPPEVRAGGGSTASFLTGGTTGTWDPERETLVAETVGAGTYAIRATPTSPEATVTNPEIRQAAVTELVRLGTEIPEEGELAPEQNPTVPAGAEVSTATGRNVFPGVAPAQSIVAVPDTSLVDIAASAETFARKFGVRAVNQSWGTAAGEPTAAVQNPYDDTYTRVADLAEAGILSVHAVANQPGEPTGGNDSGSGGAETISCVNTNSLYGVMSISSGGLVTVTDDGDYFRTPDVCAVGTNEVSAETPADTDPGEYGEVDGYGGGTGTSYAAPSVTGLCGLVTQAMEEDAPEGLRFPSPEGLYDDDMTPEDRRNWTLRAKSAILATASTTAFNAIPWHGDQAPAYTPGTRDPYEGFGRVNHGAAIDAVTRDLTETVEHDETLGLDVPDTEQAVAGYLTGPGEYAIGLNFDGYEGTDADLTNGTPHLDLFVYDARSPEGVDDDNPNTGTPTEIARSLGIEGAGGSVIVNLDADDVYVVVAKLVSVPGDGTERLPAGVVDSLPREASGFVFNGADVRANVSLDVYEGDR